MSSQIKTKLLIISDTHGSVPAPAIQPPKLASTLAAAAFSQGAHQWAPWFLPSPYREPLPHDGVDVLVHCGDLTAWAAPAEFSRTIATLRSHPAPLKLVIAGNHDHALAEGEWPADLPPEERDYDLVMDMFRAARQDGVVFLEKEGVHEFVLENGALLRVYASAWTPRFGNGAFQYDVLPNDVGHSFDIPPGVDLAITHGPPYYVLDRTIRGTHVGARALWRAVAKARPKVHCFGHIHEGWGAEMIRWKGDVVDAQDFDAFVFEHVVDQDRSETVMRDSMVKPRSNDDEETLVGKRERWHEMVTDAKACVDLEDERWKGEQDQNQDQTLFVNASIMDVAYKPLNPPWVVDVVLSRAG
jgi:hypothetical protein